MAASLASCRPGFAVPPPQAEQRRWGGRHRPGEGSLGEGMAGQGSLGRRELSSG